ncbi:hypothetical protein VM1G_00262 [Cytospora mali]|uniref:Uncharacterized protein n=1 Tax=Cytospora mali TaxID=578113 RepID=A0A194VN26_CYTMA|nr:hypothetical protein VM1G_00262 [Valsa mali]
MLQVAGELLQITTPVWTVTLPITPYRYQSDLALHGIFGNLFRRRNEMVRSGIRDEVNPKIPYLSFVNLHALLRKSSNDESRLDTMTEGRGANLRTLDTTLSLASIRSRRYETTCRHIVAYHHVSFDIAVIAFS